MTTTFEAIYENGTLRPLRQLALPEGARVEVVVKTKDGARTESEQNDKPTPASVLAEIAAQSTRHGVRETASRDHDQFLYGKQNPR